MDSLPPTKGGVPCSEQRSSAFACSACSAQLPALAETARCRLRFRRGHLWRRLYPVRSPLFLLRYHLSLLTQFDGDHVQLIPKRVVTLCVNNLAGRDKLYLFNLDAMVNGDLF